MKIFETSISSSDTAKINEVLIEGNLGFGENVSKLEEEYVKFSKKSYNIATNSASAAAYIIFAYLKELYGTCDVYTTSLGFVSPAWAAKTLGHNIIYVDVNRQLLFDSQDYLSKRIDNKNQKVLMPVLYGGVSSIQGWQIVGDEIVVTDSAHCVTPTLKTDFSFFSFHPFKPICSSDGGMISTNSQEANEYFCSYRNFGRKNIGNTYDIVQEGFKFYMNNLNATIALTSIEKYDNFLKKRKDNFDKIRQEISSEVEVIEHDTNSSYYIGSALSEKADKVMEGISLVRLYPMLHKTKMMGDNSTLRNLENWHSSIINFPIHHNLSHEEIRHIIDTILK
jgi:dTDP-4-amino-4,6-dideoxygalactose transaminase